MELRNSCRADVKASPLRTKGALVSPPDPAGTRRVLREPRAADAMRELSPVTALVTRCSPLAGTVGPCQWPPVPGGDPWEGARGAAGGTAGGSLEGTGGVDSWTWGQAGPS